MKAVSLHIFVMYPNRGSPPTKWNRFLHSFLIESKGVGSWQSLRESIQTVNWCILIGHYVMFYIKRRSCAKLKELPPPPWFTRTEIYPPPPSINNGHSLTCLSINAATSCDSQKLACNKYGRAVLGKELNASGWYNAKSNRLLPHHRCVTRKHYMPC